MQEKTRSYPSSSRGKSNDWIDKTLREGRLVWLGFLSIPEAAIKASDHLEVPTLRKVLLAFSFGFAAGRGQSTGGVKGLISSGIGTGATAAAVSLTRELTASGKVMAEAMVDTWNSDENWQKNLAVMEKSLQRIAFDSALYMAGGWLGKNAARLLWGKKKKK
jgi:hypothetical protein